jgi:hypothetical protein
MDDLTQFMDDKFHFNFHSSTQSRSFVSSIVAQFDERFEEEIPALTALIEIVNRGRDSNSLQLQRFSVWHGQKATSSVANVIHPTVPD